MLGLLLPDELHQEPGVVSLEQVRLVRRQIAMDPLCLARALPPQLVERGAVPVPSESKLVERGVVGVALEIDAAVVVVAVVTVGHDFSPWTGTLGRRRMVNVVKAIDNR